MCGFFGFFKTNKNFKVDKKIYKNISLKYRGPDEHTVFENNNFYCEFFRLSILGPKPAKRNARKGGSNQSGQRGRGPRNGGGANRRPQGGRGRRGGRGGNRRQPAQSRDNH